MVNRSFCPHRCLVRLQRVGYSAPSLRPVCRSLQGRRLVNSTPDSDARAIEADMAFLDRYTTADLSAELKVQPCWFQTDPIPYQPLYDLGAVAAYVYQDPPLTGVFTSIYGTAWL